MNKFAKKVAITLCLTLPLVACDALEEANEKAIAEAHFTEIDHVLTITTHKETGCKYIIYKGTNAGGISPLMLPNGEQDCGYPP